MTGFHLIVPQLVISSEHWIFQTILTINSFTWMFHFRSQRTWKWKIINYLRCNFYITLLSSYLHFGAFSRDISYLINNICSRLIWKLRSSLITLAVNVLIEGIKHIFQFIYISSFKHFRKHFQEPRALELRRGKQYFNDILCRKPGNLEVFPWRV